MRNRDVVALLSQVPQCYDSISSTQSELVAGDLVTQSVVSISIFMHPQRWLLQNINLSKVLQRRVSISNSRECKVVHDWRSGHSLCCFDLNYHAPSTLIAQNINLIKVYDSISSSISSTQSEYEKQSRIGTSLLSQVHPMFIVVCWVWYRFNILRMLFYPIRAWSTLLSVLQYSTVHGTCTSVKISGAPITKNFGQHASVPKLYTKSHKLPEYKNQEKKYS